MNLKYRIWDYDNNAFDYIDLLNIEKTIETLDSFRDYFHADYLHDNANFIQKFVGLQDVTGEEIYQGDILQEGDETIWSRYEVIWNENFCSFTLDHKRVSPNVQYPSWNRAKNMRRIGNIIENPELLNLGKQL